MQKSAKQQWVNFFNCATSDQDNLSPTHSYNVRAGHQSSPALWSRNLKTNISPSGDLNPQPPNGQPSTPTTTQMTTLQFPTITNIKCIMKERICSVKLPLSHNSNHRFIQLLYKTDSSEMLRFVISQLRTTLIFQCIY